MEITNVLMVRKGRIVFQEFFWDHAEALDALGLSEQAMSQENVEVVRHSYEAFEREGLDGFLRYFHPEIEWITTGAFVEPGSYRGHEGVRRYIGSVLDEFEDVRVEPEELIDAGDEVVTSVRFTGRGRLSGVPVELTLTSVGSFRDGMTFRIRNYPTKAEALEAAGLSE